MSMLLQRVIHRLVKHRSSSNDDDIYLYLILLTASIFVSFVHTYLLIFFIVVQIPLLILFNCISLSINLFCLYQTQRRRYTLVGLLISFEVFFYAVINMYLTGFQNYTVFYFFLIMIMQQVAPYGKLWMRSAITALMLVALLMVVPLSASYVPPIDLGFANVVFSYSNVVISFLASILELSIGNVIRKMLDLVTDRRMVELENQAHTDPLTGLFNRRYADIFFENIRANPLGKPWCAAMLDIDDFKLINDERGHAVGDRVLIALAGTVRKNLRKSDEVFRWGGEEFLIMLENVDLQNARIVLEKIRTALARLNVPATGTPVRFTVTIGSARFDPLHVQESINECDRKLYQGKASGKNKVIT